MDRTGARQIRVHGVDESTVPWSSPSASTQGVVVRETTREP